LKDKVVKAIIWVLATPSFLRGVARQQVPKFHFRACVMRGVGQPWANCTRLYVVGIWIGSENCHSAEKSPFRDDDSRSAGQEYPSLYGTRRSITIWRW